MEHKTASAEELNSDKMMGSTNSGKENLEGRYYAIGNKCTHRGCKLSNIILDGSNVECPNARAVVQYQKLNHGKVVKGLSNKAEPTFKIEIRKAK